MDFDLAALDVVHNEPQSRFEIACNGQLAFAEYRLRDGRMIISHTEVPPAFQGRGVAAKITRAALDYARSQRLPVIPTCPYTAAFIRKHTEYHDLLPAEERARFLAP